MLESIRARDTRIHLDVRGEPHIYTLVPKDPNSESMVIFSVVWTQYGTKYLVQIIRYYVAHLHGKNQGTGVVRSVSGSS